VSQIIQVALKCCNILSNFPEIALKGLAATLLWKCPGPKYYEMTHMYINWVLELYITTELFWQYNYYNRSICVFLQSPVKVPRDSSLYLLASSPILNSEYSALILTPAMVVRTIWRVYILASAILLMRSFPIKQTQVYNILSLELNDTKLFHILNMLMN